jgi:excisionase family DNA binding protein
MKRKLLTVRHVAEILDVSTRTIYRLIQRGQLPSVTVSTKRLIPFFRLYGRLQPTPVYHPQRQISSLDLNKVMFEGLPVLSRKRRDMRHINGRFAPKYEWPEVERKKKLSPIERLDEPLDL